MNLLCPNCQKQLTVPDQFAGQLMKCPLCAGTFNVPGLPAPTAPAPMPPAPSPEPAPPVETYGLKPDPVAPPASAPAPAPAAVADGSEPVPAQLEALTPAAPPPAQGYTRSVGYSLDPKMIQWVPAGALVLIFVLQFFPWVGVYPGGVPAAWQSGWSTVFAMYGEEKDMSKAFHFTTDDEVKDANKDVKDDKDKLKDNKPGVNVLMIFYCIPFFLVTLVVTIGVLLVSKGMVKLPPSLDKLMQLRWTIVAGLNLVTFLFLVLQLLLGFSLENTFKDRVGERIAREEKDRARLKMEAPPELLLKAREKAELQELHRTFWLELAVLLHIMAIIAAVTMAWIEKRGNRPLPRVVFEC